jgi:hypothetical protein
MANTAVSGTNIDMSAMIHYHLSSYSLLSLKLTKIIFKEISILLRENNNFPSMIILFSVYVLFL